jgi:ankyrin repeat protein
MRDVVVSYHTYSSRFVNVTAKNGKTPLHLAYEYGLTNIVKELLNNGENGASVNKYGDTPLHITCENSHLDLAKELLSSGTNVNARCSGVFPFLAVTFTFAPFSMRS